MKEDITKIDRYDDVQPGEYFRCVSQDEDDDGIPIGSLCLVTKVEGRKVHFATLTTDERRERGYGNEGISEWYNSIENFLKQFEHEPDGRAIRDQELREAMKGTQLLAKDITDEAQQLSSIDKLFLPKSSPNQLEAGEDKEEIDVTAAPLDEDRQVGLQKTTLTGSMMLEQATEWIGNVANRRNNISAKKLELERRKAQVNALLKEQGKWANAIARIQDVANKLEEVIGTLNLYLGTGEDITQLANGKPCAAEVPLTVRQLVLFMDEECALESDKGGIDAYSIEMFDAWLLADPKNLTQVLPEMKGVVCLKPRRNDKNYTDDAFTNSKLNQANRKTYILIRNGENLFRVCPEWEVGENFFPTKDQFRDAFTISKDLHYDEAKRRGVEDVDKIFPDKDSRRWSKRVSVTVAPEDDEYDEVLEKLDKRMARYSKALILLQGIVDRTGIFPEFQELGLNLMDVTQWTDYLRFVHDADPAYLLTSGRETFSQWHDRTRKALQVGDRVIGEYWAIMRRTRTRDDREEETRLIPKGASPPDDYGLYTLESRSDLGGLRFKYERTDKKQVIGWYTDPETGKREYATRWDDVFVDFKQKATFLVYRDDKEILAFDVITLEEMEFFMKDRLSRHDYLTIFPLMKRVRNMKRKERKDEAPFIQLCIGELMKQGIDDATEAELVKVIQWYKFKNKVHRSVKKDEANALSMVVAEFKHRRETGEFMDDTDLTEMINALKTDKTLLIAPRKGYVVRIDRVNEDVIFVNRTDFVKSRNGWRAANSKEFYIPGAEYNNWEPVYEHEEWATWPKGARSNDFLRPQEIEVITKDKFPEILKAAKEQAKYEYEGYRYSGDRSPAAKINFLELYCTTLNDEKEVVFNFVSDGRGPKAPTGSVEWIFVKVQWKRKRGNELEVTIPKSRYDYMLGSNGSAQSPSFNPDGWDPRVKQRHTIFYDGKIVAKAQKIADKYSDTEKKRRERDNYFRICADILSKKVNDERIAKAKEKYLAAYGDPLNWPNFMKDKDRAGIKEIGYDVYHNISSALGTLYAEKLITLKDVRGKTINEIELLLNAKFTGKRKKEIPTFHHVPEVDPAVEVFYTGKEREEDAEDVEYGEDEDFEETEIEFEGEDEDDDE